MAVVLNLVLKAEYDPIEQAQRCRQMKSMVPSWNDYSYTEVKSSSSETSEKSSQKSSQKSTYGLPGNYPEAGREAD
jgi:hypothetical protein